jgi:hypothetical protein
MRKFLSIVLILVVVQSAWAQQLSQVSFSNGSSLSYFSFLTDQGVLIRVSDEGTVLDWGIEVESERIGNYYARKLQPFMGKVDYYGAQDDSIFRGKVKSIGTCFLTYYDTFQVATKIGKLRSVGNLYLDYYSNYDDKSLKGKLQTAGNINMDYYRSYENESIKGKLKSVGSVPVTYYTVFDDKWNAGKLKSIGTAAYTWYSIGDNVSMRGGLKSGNQRQIVSGITYILF